MATSLIKIEKTLTSLLENFIVDTLVCMSNGINDKMLCFTIFRKACDLLNLNGRDFKQFSSVFDRLEINYLEKNLSTPIDTYGKYILTNVHRLKELWEFFFPFHKTVIERGIKILEIKIEKDGNFASWPNTDAVFIWPWLHIISIDIDLNCGLEEKKSFLKFIPEIIACGICKNHYSSHLSGLLNSLKITTCANTLLALHTHINKRLVFDETEEIKTPEFVYDKALVSLLYANRYKRIYLKFKIDSEQL